MEKKLKKALTVFEATTYNLKTIECGVFDTHIEVQLQMLLLMMTLLVGIKCPYKGRNENIKPGPHFDFLQYEINGNTVLKSSSKYNDQAQGQLFISF